MQGYKVYLTGESYAGQYIPYLADGMLNRNDTKHFNLKGIQINDPSINDDSVLIYGPLLPHHTNNPMLTPISPSRSSPKPLLLGLHPKRNLHDRNQPPRR
jgi:carboxypeptidase C (cathepsin A)